MVHYFCFNMHFIFSFVLGFLLGHLAISLRVDLIGSGSEKEKPLFLHYSNSSTSDSSLNDEQLFAVAAFHPQRIWGYSLVFDGNLWRAHAPRPLAAVYSSLSMADRTSLILRALNFSAHPVTRQIHITANKFFDVVADFDTDPNSLRALELALSSSANPVSLARDWCFYSQLEPVQSSGQQQRLPTLVASCSLSLSENNLLSGNTFCIARMRLATAFSNDVIPLRTQTPQVLATYNVRYRLAPLGTSSSCNSAAFSEIVSDEAVTGSLAQVRVVNRLLMSSGSYPPREDNNPQADMYLASPAGGALLGRGVRRVPIHVVCKAHKSFKQLTLVTGMFESLRASGFKLSEPLVHYAAPGWSLSATRVPIQTTSKYMHYLSLSRLADEQLDIEREELLAELLLDFEPLPFFPSANAPADREALARHQQLVGKLNELEESYKFEISSSGGSSPSAHLQLRLRYYDAPDFIVPLLKVPLALNVRMFRRVLCIARQECELSIVAVIVCGDALRCATW